MYFTRIPLPMLYWVVRALCTSLLLISVMGGVRGQSVDIAAPTPVSSNQISGRIAARDIGDARLTSHFYAFAGGRGDLRITVQSSNLNGDIDVFTAEGLRPLLKFTMYAESSSAISKSFYLRKREELILRVEARTPNDDEGTYEVSFGGSFEPLSAPLEAQAQTAPVTSSESASQSDAKKGRRVSSVGARIPEPEPAKEIAVAPAPEPTPATPNEGAVEATTPSEKPTSAATEKSAEPEAAKSASTSTPRSRRSSRRRGAKTAEPAKKASTEEATEARKTAPEEAATESAPSANATTESKRSGRAGRKRQRPSEQPPAEPQPPTGPRLIIQTTDGTLIERYMSSVRRVLVEQGQVVVVGKDGRVDRILLAQVVKMTIEQ